MTRSPKAALPAALLSLLAACPTAGAHRPAVELRLEAAPQAAAGGAVDLALAVTNPEPDPLTLEFASECRVHLLVTGADRRPVYPADPVWRCAAGDTARLVLAPGESRRWTERWVTRSPDGAPLPPGSYTVRGTLAEHYLVRGGTRSLKLGHAADSVLVRLGGGEGAP